MKKILKRLTTKIDIAICEEGERYSVCIVTFGTEYITSSSFKLFDKEPTKEDLSEQLHSCLSLHAIGMAKKLGAQ